MSLTEANGFAWSSRCTQTEYADGGHIDRLETVAKLNSSSSLPEDGSWNLAAPKLPPA